jgi:hypothetical protein
MKLYNFSIILKVNFSLIMRCGCLAVNDLRANEGRETKALNCKPNTNLKEISELSNYSKTSGFRLHAVSGSLFIHNAFLIVYIIFSVFKIIVN